MAILRPLVVLAGTVRELPTGDEIPLAALPTIARRNDLFAATILADVRGLPVTLIDRFADGFADSSGIVVAASSNYTVDTVNRRVAPSLAETVTTLQSSVTTVATSQWTFIDRSATVPNGAVVTKIGVNSAFARTITVKIVRRNSANNYDVVVSQSFSHGGTGWEDCTLSSAYTVPGSGTFHIAIYQNPGGGNSTVTSGFPARAYLAGDLVGNGAATTAEDTQIVWPARYATGSGVNNMTLVVGNGLTAESAPSTMRALIDIEPIDSVTLGTDFTAEVSRDGGTTWASATLSLIRSIGARRILETAEVSVAGQPSGTSPRLRLKNLNNKNLRVNGAAMLWG